MNTVEISKQTRYQHKIQNLVYVFGFHLLCFFFVCYLIWVGGGGGGGGGLVYAKEGSSICVCAQYLQGADVSYIRVMDPPCLGSIPVIDGHGL